MKRYSTCDALLLFLIGFVFGVIVGARAILQIISVGD